MNETTQTPYASPSADLVENNTIDQIKQFKRFSAWGVFGLMFITFGIYPIYWLCNRAETVNSVHEKKISKAWTTALVVSIIIYYVASFSIGLVGETGLIVMSVVTLISLIVYMVAYLVVAFAIRNRLQDITNNKLNGVLTFFFNAVYLQYKINEAIDQSK